MKLHDLSPAPGSKQSRKRVGRGPGSGLGKTAGRGHKGGQSRAGYRLRPGFEGGQMPLIRRVPKRGFTNEFRVEYAVVNVGKLEGLGKTVTPESLAEKGLVHPKMPVKILAGGKISTAMTVSAHKFSAAARDKIEAVGGRCQELA
jgi:large subunit ribosomal protein L15